MPEPLTIAAFVLPYLVKFAEREAMSTASDKLKKLPRELAQTEPVKKALEKTIEAFPTLRKHDLPFVMRMWCNSGKFEGVYKQYKSEPHSLSDELILAGFRDTAKGYNNSGEVEKQASEVLTVFFMALHEALLHSSKDGLAYHDALEEQRFHTLETKVEESQATIEVLTATNAQLVETNAQLTMRLVAPTAEVHETNSPDIKWKAQIDLALQFSESRDPEDIYAARAIVKKIRAVEEWSSLSASTHARVATLAAKCADSVGDLESMRVEVEIALTLQPDDVNCLSNAAGVALVNGDLAKAEELAKRALAKAPQNENAGLVLLQAWNPKDLSGLEEFILKNTWLFDSPHTCAALAHIRVRDGHYAEAATLAKRALKQDRTCVEALEAFSDAQFISVRQSIWKEEKWILDAKGERGLRRAESAVNRAITLLERRPNRVKLHRELSRRATIRNARNRFVEALQDCDRILLNAPTPENRDFATLSKANILIHSGRAAEAVPLFEQVEDPDLRRQNAATQAFSYQHAGRFEDAINILEGIWNPEKPESNLGEESQWLIAETLCSLYRRCGRETDAKATIIRLVNARPNSPQTVALEALERYEEGDIDGALDLMSRKADECKNNEEHPAYTNLLLRIADLSYRTHRFTRAAQTWKEIGWLNLLPTYRLAYLNSLYQTGQLSEALKLARRIKAESGFTSHAVEIEALICDYMGEHTVACDLWEELARHEPQNPRHSINRAHSALRADDEDKARSALNQVTYESIKDDAVLLRRVSAMQAHLGFKDAIRFGFRARQIDFGNPDSHSNYVQVFLISTNAHSYDADGVYDDHQAANVLGLNESVWGDVPCTIHLQPIGSDDENERRSITILEEGPFDRTHDIYGAKDEFARRLIEYAKSHTGPFPIQQSPAGPIRNYEIKQVVSHYVHAFQESGLKGTTWFGDEAKVWSHNVANGFEEFFAMLDRQSKGFNEVIEHYVQWVWPLSTVASVRGRSTLDLWFFVSKRSHWGIHAERGKTATFDQIVGKLDDHLNIDAGNGEPQQKPILVLESTSLLALVHLNFADLLTPYFRFIVPDSLRRKIRSESTEPHKPHIPDDIFTRLLTFIDQNTEILPARSVIDFSPDEIRDWQQCMGQEELDTFLLAKEHNAVALSDDAVLRQLARFHPGCESVNTQHILSFLELRGCISLQARYECLEKMAQHNFKHLLLSPHFYHWLLEKHAGIPNKTVQAAFRYLEAPSCNDEGAVKIVASVLAKRFAIPIWHQSGLLDLCILTLVTGRPIISTLTKLQSVLNHPSFGLSSEALIALELYIYVWLGRLSKKQ